MYLFLNKYHFKDLGTISSIIANTKEQMFKKQSSPIKREISTIFKRWKFMELEFIKNIKMGTSMQLSEKQKERLHFRNHAMPRKKIPPQMQKYYRYKVEYLLNRLNQNQNDQQALQQIKKITKTIKIKQVHNFHQMPNDIPSIEQHSQIMNSRHRNGDIDGQQNQSSDVYQYRLQATKPQNPPNNQLRQNQEIQAKIEKFDHQQIRKQDKSSDNDIKVIDCKKQSSISNLPNNSQPSNQKRTSQKKSSSGGKKSSDGKIQSVGSNHILSDIILKREAYYTINYDMINDDIKEEIQESSKKQKWHTCGNYQDYGAKFYARDEQNYEGQTQENQNGYDKVFVYKLEKSINQSQIQNRSQECFQQNKVEQSHSTKKQQGKQKNIGTNQFKNSQQIPNNFLGLETMPVSKAKFLSMTLQLNSIMNNCKMVPQQTNAIPAQASSPFTNKTNIPTQITSAQSNAYQNGSYQARTDIIYENSHTGLYSNNGSNLSNRPRKLLYF